MFASRDLRNKDQIVNIKNGVDHLLFNSTDVLNIINGYNGLSAPTSARMIRLFRDTSSREEISMLASLAAPFPQIDAVVNKAHARKEKHLPETLMKAALQAIRDGDVSLRDDNNVILYEGMTEKLLQLCNNLYPKLFSETLFPAFQEKARCAIPLESKEQKEDKENRYRTKIKDIFKANKNNDSDTLPALEVFKNWAAKLSVADKILLTWLARVELANEGGTLQKLEEIEKDTGSYFGFLGNRFCNEVIWDALQKNLSPRQQQVLRCGVYHVFNPERGIELIRSIDLDSSSFIHNRDFFYDQCGARGGAGRCYASETWTQKLLQAITSATQVLCHNSDLYTSAIPVLSNVES